MSGKPIKRSESLKQLSRDHHHSLLFCWKIRQGLKTDVDPQRISKYVQYFWQQHLHPHFQVEETILFAPIRDQEVQRALDEHKIIRQTVQGLENHSANDLRKVLSELAGMVDEHVRYEERHLFPHLERILNIEQLEFISTEIQKHDPSSLQDEYEDQFWHIKKLRF